jgi:hypothetical protein
VVSWPANIGPPPGGGCFDRCTVPALDRGQSHDVRARGSVNADRRDTAAADVVVDPDQALFDPVLANNRVTPIVCGTTP